MFRQSIKLFTLTSYPGGSAASTTTGLAHSMGAKAEPNQVNAVPVTASLLDEPDQEISNVVADIRDAPGGKDEILKFSMKDKNINLCIYLYYL